MTAKPGGRHADNRAGVGAHANRTPDDTGIAPEAARPETVADHHRAAIAGAELIVLLGQQASCRRREAEDGEVIAGDGAGSKVGCVGAIERHRHERIVVDGEKARQRVLTPSQLFEDWIEQDPALALMLRHELDETIGLRNRQGPQHDGIQHAEDGRRGANPERERRDGRRGEARTPAQRARRVSEILQEAVDEREPALIAIRFFHLFDSAKFTARGRARGVV